MKKYIIPIIFLITIPLITQAGFWDGLKDFFNIKKEPESQLSASVLYPYFGGTGQNTADWTGFPYITSGTWGTSTITSFETDPIWSASSGEYLTLILLESNYYGSSTINASNTAWELDTDSWPASSSEYLTIVLLENNYYGTSTIDASSTVWALDTDSWPASSSEYYTSIIIDNNFYNKSTIDASSTAWATDNDSWVASGSEYYTIPIIDASSTAWATDNDSWVASGSEYLTKLLIINNYVSTTTLDTTLADYMLSSVIEDNYYGTTAIDASSTVWVTDEKCFTLNNPTSTDLNIWMWTPNKAITITDVYCGTVNATSIAVVVEDFLGNALESVTCDEDGQADDGSIANGTFSANEGMRFDIGAISNYNEPCWVNYCITYKYDAQ